MQHPLLIDCETLQARLGQPGLVILDVRGRSTYEFGGHIPGAVHSTWHEYSDPEAIAKGLLDPDLKRLEQRVQSLGINRDSEVVIYSNPFDNWGDEGRMFWMLEYLGHKNIKVLDGGWVKWIHERRPFEHGADIGLRVRNEWHGTLLRYEIDNESILNKERTDTTSNKGEF